MTWDTLPSVKHHEKQDRMIREVLSSIGHIYCFQGAEEHLCELLMLPRSDQPDEDFRDRGRTSRKKGKVQRDQRWYVVRGPEKGSTTAVAVRTWPFKGIRRECFIRSDASCQKGNTKFNRTLFVTLKFNKNYFLTGPDKDQLGVCSAHLHYGCANSSNKRGNELRTLFWDSLARGIVHYKTRILCIDANMALTMVAIELRARGFCITLVAWFPCRFLDKLPKPEDRLDTTGIFVIGRTHIIRPAYTPTVFKAAEPNWGEGRYIQTECKNQRGLASARILRRLPRLCTE